MRAATPLDPTPTYGMSRHVSLSFAEAVEKITATLAEQGFGILTEIDVKATLKKKIDQDFTDYVILGACNPKLAHRGLGHEIALGLLLPCNVAVYVDPENGKTVVAVLDPGLMVQMTGNAELEPIAQEAKQRLEAALDAIE